MAPLTPRTGAVAPQGVELLSVRVLVCAEPQLSPRFADALRAVGGLVREADRSDAVRECAQWVPAAILLQFGPEEDGAALDVVCSELRGSAAPMRLAVIAIVPPGDARTRERAGAPGPDGFVTETIASSLLGPYVAGLIQALSQSGAAPPPGDSGRD